MVKEEGNPGNLAALPTMMDFLDDSDRCERPGRTQSTITKHLENLVTVIPVTLHFDRRLGWWE